MDKSTANIIFAGQRAKDTLEYSLLDADLEFERTSYDDYDRSMELYDIQNDYRITEEVRKIFVESDFSKIYMNHKDHWETHYNKKDDFRKGWRVSYPRKRPEDGRGILVEEKPESWPEDWFKNGKGEIVGKQKETNLLPDKQKEK